MSSLEVRPINKEYDDELPPKLCTKTKKCQGQMVWKPRFRNLGTKEHPIYRPAWFCEFCGKHDYIKGGV